MKVRPSVNSATDRRVVNSEIDHRAKNLVIGRLVEMLVIGRSANGVPNLLVVILETALHARILAIGRLVRTSVIGRGVAVSAAVLAESMDSMDAPLVRADIALARSAKAASVEVPVAKVVSNRDLRAKEGSRVDQSGRVVSANQVAGSAKVASVEVLVVKAAALPAREAQGVPADLAEARREMVARAAAGKSGD